MFLETYNLPSFFSLFSQQRSKSEWKKTLNDSVHSHIEASWQADLSVKTSLRYINPNSLKVGKAHPVWSIVRNSLIDNKRAKLNWHIHIGMTKYRKERSFRERKFSYERKVLFQLFGAQISISTHQNFNF